MLISGVVESDGLSIDAEIPVQYLSDNLYSDISIIEPYGECNEMPLLYTKSITVENFSVVGKDQSHLKLTLNTGSGVLNAVYWGKAGWFKSLHNESNHYDIVYKIDLNHFKGNITVQLKIVNMELSV